MPDNAKAVLIPLEDALRAAMVLAWDDFCRLTVPHAIRVEYWMEPGRDLDNLTIWLVRPGGYQERMCDYRLRPALHYPREWRCWARVHSENLLGALDLIMRHPNRFLPASGASREGLLVVFPPTPQERAAAAAWMSQAKRTSLPSPVKGTRAAAQAS